MTPNQPAVSVLLIDDDEDDFFLLKDLLDEFPGRYQVEWASGFEAATEKTASSQYDVFLLDYRLGAYTALDVLEHMRKVENHGPVIVLTGVGNETIDRDALHLGAADYLIKSKLDSQVLDRTIRYAMERVRNIESMRENERQQQTLEKLASNSRIARIIAHEVRNPLTNINLSVENILAEGGEQLENIRPLLEIISRNAVRINQLITQLLGSTVFEDPDFSPHDINEVLEETLLLAQDRIQLKNIRVEKRLADNICPVKIDKEKIKIALLNLIINAVEAVEENTGTITLVTEKRQDRCVVRITDNGPGIPEEYLSRLFEPFFTRKQAGTGLGLTSTQSIILSHKGTINVSSEPGKGTRFTVTLETSS